MYAYGLSTMYAWGLNISIDFKRAVRAPAWALKTMYAKALCVHVYVRVYVCVMCLKASGRGGLEISIDLVPY